MNRKDVREERCRSLLDRALLFAARNTDPQGRMAAEGEIDCKDPGWMVFGAVIRIALYGDKLETVSLGEICRRWTLAAIRVDDTRSAWTTFALLLAMDVSGGVGGFFHSLFSADEQKELRKFFLQIDIGELLAASRNYHIAAAVIDTLRCRFGYLDKPVSDPVADIQYMFDGYLGDGFFNDDDGRGSRDDRRIDAYSGEIIGLAEKPIRILRIKNISGYPDCPAVNIVNAEVSCNNFSTGIEQLLYNAASKITISSCNQYFHSDLLSVIISVRSKAGLFRSASAGFRQSMNTPTRLRYHRIRR